MAGRPMRRARLARNGAGGAADLRPGTRVLARGKPGSVNYVRYASLPPYGLQAVSVLLDERLDRPGYEGTIYPAEAVHLEGARANPAGSAFDDLRHLAHLLEYTGKTLARTRRAGAFTRSAVAPVLGASDADWLDWKVENGLANLMHLYVGVRSLLGDPVLRPGAGARLAFNAGDPPGAREARRWMRDVGKDVRHSWEALRDLLREPALAAVTAHGQPLDDLRSIVDDLPDLLGLLGRLGTSMRLLAR